MAGAMEFKSKCDEGEKTEDECAERYDDPLSRPEQYL
jgi:hypothetical protein